MARVFYLIEGDALNDFTKKLKDITGKNAKSQLTNFSYIDKNVKTVAREYIQELRLEQLDIVDREKDIKKAVKDINFLETEIKNVKKNGRIKLRLEAARRTTSYIFTKLLKTLWRNKGRTASLSIAIIGAISGLIAYTELFSYLKKGAREIHRYGMAVAKMGKDIKDSIDGIYKIPGDIAGNLLIFLGSFLQIFYRITLLGGTFFSSALSLSLGLTIKIFSWYNTGTEEALVYMGETLETIGDNMDKNATVRLSVKERSVLQLINYAASNTEKIGGKVLKKAGSFFLDFLFFMQIILAIVIVVIIIKWSRN